MTVVAPPGEGRPDEGTVSLTLSHSSVEDLGSNIGPEGEPKATVNYIHDDTAPQMVLYQEPHRTASNAAAFDVTVTFSEPVLGFTASDVSSAGPRTPDAWYVNRLFGQDADYEFMTKQPTGIERDAHRSSSRPVSPPTLRATHPKPRRSSRSSDRPTRRPARPRSASAPGPR